MTRAARPGWSRRFLAAILGAVFLGGYAGGSAQPARRPGVGDTVRFLEQSTFGPTLALTEDVRARGFEAFLSEQFAAELTSYPDLPPMPATRPSDCTGDCQRDHYTMYPLQVHFFRNAIEGKDQLRQRVAWALGQILVTSGLDVTLSSWMAPYQQLLYQSAFGNYRQLLYDVTRSAAMGRYLDVVNNQCQTGTPRDPAICQTGAAVKPNENYARELLQLFSIGVSLLNPDGTPVLDGEGRPVPAYDQEVIEEFSRVFTGWILAPQFAAGVPNYRDPMRVSEGRHDRGPKTLLGGATLPGGQSTDEELHAALDNIMAHPNVGPFISRQLIQHLVTSNPTAVYVRDVANVFSSTIDSPTQLQEVVRAILLHSAARGNVKSGPRYGRLREPVLFITGVLRALHATTDGVLNSVVVGPAQIGSSQLSQNVFNPPSVFNFYSFEHLVAGTDPPLFGPEFQIHSTTTAIRRANFVNQVVFAAIPGTTVDLAPFLEHAARPGRLVTELDRLFLHGAMPRDMRALVLEAVNGIPESEPLLRVQQAIYLVATSSQYQVER
jgi:uncharacterized protein (DUF1800 family)